MLLSEQAVVEVVAHDLQPALSVDVTGCRGVDRRESWILVGGVLDMVTEEILAESLAALLDTAWGSQIVVDLADVSFVSVNGILLLANAAARARSIHGSLVVRRPPPTARRMIELFELGLALPIDDLGL